MINLNCFTELSTTYQRSKNLFIKFYPPADYYIFIKKNNSLAARNHSISSPQQTQLFPLIKVSLAN